MLDWNMFKSLTGAQVLVSPIKHQLQYWFIFLAFLKKNFFFLLKLISNLIMCWYTLLTFTCLNSFIFSIYYSHFLTVIFIFSTNFDKLIIF